MHWEGRAAAVSLSVPPTFIYNLFRIFNAFSLYLMNATLFMESSSNREQDMQKNEAKSSKTERERELIVANDELEGLASAVTAIRAVGGGCRASRTMGSSYLQ